MAVAIRPFAARDAGAVADVLFVATCARAAARGGAPELEVPAEARRFVERLLEVDPMGGHVAECDGEVVGAGWTHGRGRVAGLGPLAVLPRHRGQGLGRRLLEACMAALGGRGAQVRVVEDAADTAALGFFVRAGFRVVSAVFELERPLAAGTAVAPPGAGAAVRVATAAEQAELVARDARSWGAARAQDVSALLAHGRAAVLVRHDRTLAHAFARRVERVVRLGPAAGDDGTLVAALLAQLAAEAAAEHALPARVLVPATDRRLVDGLVAHGFGVRGTLLYLAVGGGTAPPPGYALGSRLLA